MSPGPATAKLNSPMCDRHFVEFNGTLKSCLCRYLSKPRSAWTLNLTSTWQPGQQRRGRVRRRQLRPLTSRMKPLEKMIELRTFGKLCTVV